MKRIFAVCGLLGLLLVSGCAGMPGTNAGALVGGIAGAALSRDPIAGAVIGGVGGALIGNMIDNSGGGGYGYRGNRGYYSNPGYSNPGYSDRAYEEQMQWRRLQQQRQWEQQRYYGGRGCNRC